MPIHTLRNFDQGLVTQKKNLSNIGFMQIDETRGRQGLGAGLVAWQSLFLNKRSKICDQLRPHQIYNSHAALFSLPPVCVEKYVAWIYPCLSMCIQRGEN